MFSQRTTFEQTPNALSSLTEARRASGEPLLDLTLANPTRAELVLDDEGLREALLVDPTSYRPDCFGDEAARSAIANGWAERGVSVPTAQIALTASTSEAYAMAFKLLCDPGDAVLIPRPGYPLLAELARFESIRLRDYRLAYDGAWHIDFPSLEAALCERARAIVVVSPNNPTGNVLTEQEFGRLQSYGLPIISDEVFSEYALLQSARRSVIAPSRVGLQIVLDGLSKRAALPQLKAAWMTLFGDPEHVQLALGRLEFLLDAYLSVNTPVQLALPRLLEIGERRRAAVMQRLCGNLELLDRRLAESAVTRLHCEAGWYAVLHLPSVRTEAEWVEGLLRDAGVLVSPGWFFDFETEPYCVVSLLTPSRDFEAGVQRLLAYVARHLDVAREPALARARS